MRAIDLIKISKEILEPLSKIGVRINDYEYINMYHEYVDLRQEGNKKEYIWAILSNKYKLSESTVYRIVSRLEKSVKI